MYITRYSITIRKTCNFSTIDASIKMLHFIMQIILFKFIGVFDMSLLKSIFSIFLNVSRILFITASFILDKIIVRKKTQKTMNGIVQHVIENSSEEELTKLSKCNGIYGDKAREHLKNKNNY